MLDYIIWNVSPYILGEHFHVRWYGLFFAIGFFISYRFLSKIFIREGLRQEDTDNLTFITFFFLLIGLRLGHCLFYEPQEYLSNPIKILYIWEGGLASHGGAIGVLCAFLWFSHKSKRPFIWILSRCAIVIPFTAFFVRMGNLMNSEIYGIATTLPWGFVFVRDAIVNPDAQGLTDALSQAGLVSSEIVENLHQFLSTYLPNKPVTFTSLRDLLIQCHFITDSQAEDFTRCCIESGILSINHPTQIYEALTYLFTGCVLVYYYQRCVKKNKPVSDYFILAIGFLMLFATRFCFEFIKNDQVGFEQGMTLNMGQLLSIPFIICGLVFVILSIREKKNQKSTF